VFDLKPPEADVRAEVIEGLSRAEKRLPPKYFYDEAGSRLFEAITELPEYYLTRTELDIFDAHLPDLARRVSGRGRCVVEYGSGSSLKIRRLLEELRPEAYVPVDISGSHLVAMARSLAEDFPDLAIYPTCADFTDEFPLPPPVRGLSKLGFFPGSSIGNFDRAAAGVFLGHVCATLGAGAHLIVGVDLTKDARVLEAAYNDAQGVTAAFNRNVLAHLGRVLEVDFRPELFRHRAVFDPALGAMRMYLDVLETHEVVIGATTIRFEAGESVHTENSFKYHPEEFRELAGAAGFEAVELWTDAKGWFGVFLLAAASA
jgi:dimethylhistidine N-methyltransferase